LEAGRFEAIVSFLVQSALERRWGGVGYRNPQLKRLLEVEKTTAEPEAVDQAYREMSELLRADQPVAFLFRHAVPHLIHRRVKGLNAPWRTNPLLFTEDLWLEDRPEG
jgi:ABC-type oligopeptide transport system substrate-binding subunit